MLIETLREEVGGDAAASSFMVALSSNLSMFGLLRNRGAGYSHAGRRKSSVLLYGSFVSKFVRVWSIEE